jgi:hypothetical protein
VRRAEYQQFCGDLLAVLHRIGSNRGRNWSCTAGRRYSAQATVTSNPRQEYGYRPSGTCIC